ncbi:hypothetical protein NHJ13051_000210 [Beauveria bassiana]
MCVWVTSQQWTLCGCTSQDTEQKPTCGCPTVIPKGTQVWEGNCGRPQCPKSS